MEKRPVCAAVIVAAGTGKRMGTSVSKQYLLLDGKEILAHTVEKFENSALVDELILVVGQNEIGQAHHMAQQYRWKKVAAVVRGGAERQDSIWNGISRTSPSAEIVLLHDGVRPFVTEEMIRASIQTASEVGACTVGMPVKDTIKVCGADGMALETPERSRLWQIQTPQTFRREVIFQAFEKAQKDGFLGTDDTSVAEYAGFPVKVIPGSYRNIKITTQEDLLVAKAFLREGCREEKSVPPKSDRRGECMKTVTIYTDGACSGNPGPGGYGTVLLDGEARREFSDGFRLTTNNRMEILAAIKGLEALEEPCKVLLYSDSKYVVDAIEKGWVKKWQKNGWMRNQKERALNVDLWERMLVLLEKHQVSFHWVKGHAGTLENERCDALARAAIQSGNLKEDEMYSA